ncbi:MAG: acyl-CoA thioesterase [Verrucomicrobia bacterium]|nr:acyl-CoA thioesterase [Verrucomicrobiota bacterium]
MAYEFKMTRCVEFPDTDMAGIMHFTNFFRFMEAAEHAFHRSLGFSVNWEKADKSLGVGWPRVKAECEYKRPLRFEDEVEIHLLVREVGAKTMTYLFIFRKHEDGKPVEVARGSLTVVCVTKDKAAGGMKAVVIPAAIRAKIQVAPAELLPKGN